MKHKFLSLRNAFFLLMIIALFSTSSIAQKKPFVVVNDFDVEKLCRDKPPSKEFCENYNKYMDAMNNGDFSNAVFYRKEVTVEGLRMINRYYNNHIAKKEHDRALLRTIFDVLEIGASVAIAVTNGERAKEVIGSALTGFQAGRNSLNNNFELLKTKVLINKMREDRAEIETKIYEGLARGAREYTWTDAKLQLQDYFFAGTFSHALNSLVGDTGADADKAEFQLSEVKKRPIVEEATKAEVDKSFQVRDNLAGIEKLLTGSDDDKAKAAKALNAVIAALRKNDSFDKFFNDAAITEKSSAADMYKALRQLMRQSSEKEFNEITDAVIANGGIK